MRYLYTLLAIMTGFVGPIVYAFIEHEELLLSIANQPTSLLYIFGLVLLLVTFRNLDTYFDKGIGRNFYRAAFIYRKIKMIGFLGAFFGLINFLGEYASTINDLLLIIIIGQIIGSTFGYLATADYAKEKQSE